MKRSTPLTQISLIKKQIKKTSRMVKKVRTYGGLKRMELKVQLKSMLDKTHEMMGY